MTTNADPKTGTWYRHVDKGQKFEVVVIDSDAQTVEIQYFDGSLEELDLDAWYDLDIEPTEPTEDWTGPIDAIERDDLGYSETGMQGDDWNQPLREYRRAPEQWELEDPESTQDKLGEGYPNEEPLPDDE